VSKRRRIYSLKYTGRIRSALRRSTSTGVPSRGGIRKATKRRSDGATEEWGRCSRALGTVRAGGTVWRSQAVCDARPMRCVPSNRHSLMIFKAAYYGRHGFGTLAQVAPEIGVPPPLMQSRLLPNVLSSQKVPKQQTAGSFVGTQAPLAGSHSWPA